MVKSLNKLDFRNFHQLVMQSMWNFWIGPQDHFTALILIHDWQRLPQAWGALASELSRMVESQACTLLFMVNKNLWGELKTSSCYSTGHVYFGSRSYRAPMSKGGCILGSTETSFSITKAL